MLFAFLSDNRFRARQQGEHAEESDEDSDADMTESDSERSRATKLAIRSMLPPDWQRAAYAATDGGKDAGDGGKDDAGDGGKDDGTDGGKDAVDDDKLLLAPWRTADHDDEDDWGPGWRGDDNKWADTRHDCHGDNQWADCHGDNQWADWHGDNQWADPTHGDNKWVDWHGDNKWADWHGDDNKWADHGDDKWTDWHGDDNKWADHGDDNKWADWHGDDTWADWHGDNDWADHGDDKKWAAQTWHEWTYSMGRREVGQVLATFTHERKHRPPPRMPPQTTPPKSAPTPKVRPKTPPRAKARPTPPDAAAVPEPVFAPKTPPMAPPPHLYDGKDDDSDDSGKDDAGDASDASDSDKADADAEAEVLARAEDMAGDIDETMVDSIIDELAARRAEASGGITEAQRNAANRAFNELIGKKCTRGTKSGAGRKAQRKRTVEMMVGSAARGSGSRLVNPRAVAEVLRDI